MSNTKITKTKTTKEHNLEEFFDIERGSTEVVEVERKTELVEAEGYDEKDREIEEDYQEIYDRAMEGHDILADEVEECESKFKARIGEVSLQHLNVALNAASKKAALKQHKDKLRHDEKNGNKGKVVNNNILIDRNDLLQQLKDAKQMDNKEPIDVDVEEESDD